MLSPIRRRTLEGTRRIGGDMARKRIKSCPFCGSDIVDICRTNKNACWIECANCTAQTESNPLLNEAIKIWNRRSRKISYATVRDDQNNES